MEVNIFFSKRLIFANGPKMHGRKVNILPLTSAPHCNLSGHSQSSTILVYNDTQSVTVIRSYSVASVKYTGPNYSKTKLPSY